MREHEVRARRPGERLPRRRELAWRLAEVAADPVPVEPEVAETVADRLLDDVAVAVAALDRDPPTAARAQALAHPRPGGSTVLGLGPGTRVAAEWAAWANGTAVRELDFHDTFLAADFAHPGDNIPPLLAVAQQCRRSGAIVDEQALVEALDGGRLAGAGLDVFATEPLPPDHPLRTAPNVVLTPHIGWKVEEVFAEWAEIAAEQLDAWLAGRLPASEVLDPAAVEVPRDRLGGLDG